jgi:phytoene/squalene synthetase
MKLQNTDFLKIVDRIDFENIIDHPNILIAAHFWEEERYRAAKVCYKFMRMIDDLVDDRKSSGESFTENEIICFTDQVHDWINCLNDLYSADPFVKEIIETVNRFKIPPLLFQNFSKSMIYDINHHGFDTFNDFIKYSEGASVAPASVFVHLCGLRKNPQGFELPSFDVIEAARPCAIFSYLVHIIRDFQKDQLNHLNYFASDILKKYDLTPADLEKIAKGGAIPASFRLMIAEYVEQAAHYSKGTLNVLNTIKHDVDPMHFLSLHIIYHLYLMVFERIDVEKGRFTREELNPKPSEIKERVIETINDYCKAGIELI